MVGYWFRHRFLFTLLVSVITAIVSGMLFARSYILNRAGQYNSESIYKNTEIDFVLPEPSFEQVSSLPGTHGIDKIFPYFLTKMSVKVEDKSQKVTLLLSDDFTNIDITMYNDTRLIEKSSIEYNNPIFVDLEFCKTNNAQIGDEVCFTINGVEHSCQIYAIYENNTLYDGGSALLKIDDSFVDAIMEQAVNNGYSGMYLSCYDYDECKKYLTNEYIPLGRLKERELFDSEDQYQTHYNAIMNAVYANEISDFHVKYSSDTYPNPIHMIIFGVAISSIILLMANILLRIRGCEKVYFIKHCIPKGQKVVPYYIMSFFTESILTIVFYFVVIFYVIKSSSIYIPRYLFYDFSVLLIPAAFFVVEIINIVSNCAFVSAKRKK